jgi:hypothetical protein
VTLPWCDFAAAALRHNQPQSFLQGFYTTKTQSGPFAMSPSPCDKVQSRL